MRGPDKGKGKSNTEEVKWRKMRGLKRWKKEKGIEKRR